MTTLLFTGPTLPADVASAMLPEAIALPPARQGDVWRAVRTYRPRAVGLIDGVFLHEPAVWHREFLWAMAQGVHVLGAASMGALRAAELAPFGMRGVGRIFEAYRSGIWPGFDDAFEDDDEVAVIHAPAELGAAQLSDALVDLRATLLAAEAAGVVTRAERDALFATLKTLPFPQRSFSALADAADGRLAPERAAALRAWLPTGRVACKRLDAEALMRALAEVPAEPFVGKFRLEHVQVWENFVRASAADADEALVLEELRLLPAEWRALAGAALGRLVARGTEGDARDALDRIRGERRLARRADLDAWRHANALDEEKFARLLHDEAALDAAVAAAPAGLDAAIADAARLAGRFAALLARGRAKQAALSGLPPARPGPERDAALDWFADHAGIKLSVLRKDIVLAEAAWREYQFRRRMG